MNAAPSQHFRAIIADDHQIVRTGLRIAIEALEMVESRPIKVDCPIPMHCETINSKQRWIRYSKNLQNW